jgi:membrane protein YqaA with SNARE-associated domain
MADDPPVAAAAEMPTAGPVARKMGPLRRLYHWVLHWADTPYGPWALVAISFAESSFFPVPPDVLLIALALGQPKKGLYFAFLCTVASVFGGLFGYAIGHFLMEEIGWRVIDLYELRQPFERVLTEFRDNAFVAVVLAGFTPIPYKVFTIAAGASGAFLPTFMVASVVGRGGRFFLVAGLIRLFGDKVKGFIDRYFNLLTVVVGIAVILGFLAMRLL